MCSWSVMYGVSVSLLEMLQAQLRTLDLEHILRVRRHNTATEKPLHHVLHPKIRFPILPHAFLLFPLPPTSVPLS